MRTSVRTHHARVWLVAYVEPTTSKLGNSEPLWDLHEFIIIKMTAQIVSARVQVEYLYRPSSS